MLSEALASLQRKPVPAVTLTLYIVCVGLMAWIRLGILSDDIVTIGYFLPLLICLWYPDRRLLWSLMVTYALIGAYKVFVAPTEWQANHWAMTWSMQMMNMLVIGVAVHLVIDLTTRLRRQKAEVLRSNDELKTRDQKISRQNDELQSQTAELAQRNVEIQQKSEELQAQSKELQQANSESAKRQGVLQSLLESLRLHDSRELPGRICQLLMSLLGEATTAVFILEKNGDELMVRAQAGEIELLSRRWPFKRSFAAVVMAHDRTAYVPDLQLRPDLVGVPAADSALRSVLGTPLRLAGKPAGVVTVYSAHKHEWTREQFQIIEWVSAQCSLLMDSRRLQTELQRANSDLDRVVKERTKELQELVNELEHFSYTITHDLRAPLRAMHGFAGLLADESMAVLNEQSREYLTRISTAAVRMDRLITDALSYSKVVRKEMPVEAVDVGHLLRGMMDSYPIFQRPQAQIEIADNLPLVLGNEAGLTQCFSNLLGNAVKFVPPGRTPVVRITGRREGDKVKLWCEDNGIGIPDDMHSRVFVMFQRLSKDYEGTGIGLTLVKKVVERMHGSVEIESTGGKGCRFRVELNAAESTS